MYVPYIIAQVVSVCFLLAALGLIAVSVGTNYWSERTFLLSYDGASLERLKKQQSAFYEIEKVDGLWRECSAIFFMQNKLVEGTHDSFMLTRALVYEYCYNRYQRVVDQSRQLLNDPQFDSRAIESKDHEITWWQIATMATMCAAALFGAAATFATPMNYPKCRGLTAFLVLVAAIATGSGLVIYSYRFDRDEIPHHNGMEARTLKSHFGWSLWCAAGACASFLASSLGFVIAARIRHLRDYSRVA